MAFARYGMEMNSINVEVIYFQVQLSLQRTSLAANLMVNSLQEEGSSNKQVALSDKKRAMMMHEKN